MKVAIIGTRGYPYIYGGYETFAKELAERLIKKSIEVTIYCHRNLFKSFPKRVNGIQLVYIPTIERKSLNQFVHSFQSILHASLFGADIILVVNPANGPFGIITRILRRKSIINTDGLEWLRPKWKGLGARYFHMAARFATKLYDVVVTDSFEMQKVYLKEFSAASTVIAYGANVSTSKNPALIKKWDLDPHGYYLIVGRLIPDNNADIIIREFVKTQSIKRLVIVGDVPYKDAYAQNIKRITDKRVVFTGYVNDQEELNELFHNCFAYIHGHEFGGTNPTMLTAMACGCAIVSLDTPFTREMCEDEAHALYFNKHDGSLESLIDSIESDQTILTELRRKAPARISQNYTWDKIVAQYMELFRELC